MRKLLTWITVVVLFVSAAAISVTVAVKRDHFNKEMYAQRDKDFVLKSDSKLYQTNYPAVFITETKHLIMYGPHAKWMMYCTNVTSCIYAKGVDRTQVVANISALFFAMADGSRQAQQQKAAQPPAPTNKPKVGQPFAARMHPSK